MNKTPTVAVPLAVVAVALSACGSAAVSQVRFQNQPIVERVNDRRNVTAMPEEIDSYNLLYYADRSTFIRVERALEVRDHVRALDVNALGEVPDSTWFTNRIGTRDVTVDEIARGPNRGPGPVLPLTVKKSKPGGKAAGFIAKDAAGTTYIVKFDSVEAPLIETSTDVIVQRLLWAAGYFVPENYVVYASPDQIVVNDKSTIKDLRGNKRKMTRADLDGVLATVDRRPSGKYRMLASKFLPGRPIGGFLDHGVRRDDPNDLIPHQHRRSLRGLYALFSWLGYTDVKSTNTLDIWIEDESNNRNYVVHYLLDFGKSFGAFTTAENQPADGHAYELDYFYSFVSIFTLGLWKRPWEGTTNPGIEGVATFDAEHFHPGKWKPHWPWVIFLEKDRFDMFWAAKIIMRFSPELIRAAVKQGQFEDPKAVDYLTDVLVKRARKVGRYWFSQVNPLDGFRIEGSEGQGYSLCFRDLVADYKLEPSTRRIQYRAATFDYAGKRTGHAQGARTPCLTGLRPAKSHDGYLIVRIETVRDNNVSPIVEVHMARHPTTRALRVVGINRR